VLPVLAYSAGVALPLVVLVSRAMSGEATAVRLFTETNVQRTWQTVLLAGGVLAVVTLIAWPMAWFVTRTDLRGRRWLSMLAVLPLALPGYLMAYALRSVGGYGGPIHAWTGWMVERPSGYVGALVAMAAYTLPYLFLTLRAGMLSLDPSLEEAARSLGQGRWRVLWGVVVPQLRPAYLAGAMLVVLHVVGDFAVVTMMDYETLSRDLYVKLSSGAGDWSNAARSGLLLLAVASVFIFVEMFLLRGLRVDRAGSGGGRKRSNIRLGAMHGVGWLLFLSVFFISVALPVGTIVYWTVQGAGVADAGGSPDLANFFEHSGDTSGGGSADQVWQAPSTLAKVTTALLASLKCSLPAAVFATALAVPVAMLRARYPSRASFLLERLPYLGYATPAIAFALSLILLCLWGMPGPLQPIGTWLYQSLPLLLYAYVLHFLPEAVGPIRSSFYHASPRVEEASRSLGRGRLATFGRVTLPSLRHGLIVAAALVFLSCMKELPLTTLLAPSNTNTLAMEVWSYSEESLYERVAPYALTILIFSSAFVGVLLLQGRENR